MLNRKSLIGKLLAGIGGVLIAYLIILGTARAYDIVPKLLPISEAQTQLAQAGVTQNMDWKPTIHQFNGMDWALVLAGRFQMGTYRVSTERSAECV